MRCVGIIVFILIFVLLPCTSQNKKELEEKKIKYQKEIDYTNKLIKQNSEKQKGSIEKLRLIDRKLDIRKNLILNMNAEIGIINNRIIEKNQIIKSLKNDLDEIKREYEKLIYYAYKNHVTNDIMLFILSSESFNKAYKRFKYLKQYSQYRKKQSNIINALRKVLKKSIYELEKKKKNREKLLTQRFKEKKVLNNEKGEQKLIITNLKSNELELKRKLKEQKRITENIENEIIKLLQKYSKEKKLSLSYKNLSPEDKLISNGFRRNKGSHVWPTDAGIITTFFGEQTHPVLKNIKIYNNGIDIATEKGSEVNALYDGVVSKIFGILGANYAIIIRHGNFYTVYQNIIKVSVKIGDSVKTGNIIGYVYTDEKSNSSLLHLEIWEELKKLNPEIWLATR